MVGIEWRGGEWTRGYEGAKTFERGTFDFRGRENFRERRRLYGKTAFSGLRLEEFVGMLQGSIGCWEFWARGPRILTESWS
jgi:hypothetical protein